MYLGEQTTVDGTSGTNFWNAADKYNRLSHDIWIFSNGTQGVHHCEIKIHWSDQLHSNLFKYWCWFLNMSVNFTFPSLRRNLERNSNIVTENWKIPPTTKDTHYMKHIVYKWTKYKIHKYTVFSFLRCTFSWITIRKKHDSMQRNKAVLTELCLDVCLWAEIRVISA